MRRLFLLAFIWGWSFLFIKVAVGGMTPTTVAGLRVALGGLVLLAMLRSRGLELPRSPAMWGHFTVVALVGSAVPFSMLAWGEERITSALTAVLNASTPLFTALAAAALLRERLRPVHGAGLLLGLAGVAVAAGVGGADLAGSSFSGSMAAVGAGACYGLAFAYMRRHLMGLSPLVAATGQLVMSSLLLAPFAVATSVAEGFEGSPSRLASIVLLGAVGTGLAYILNYQVIADLGATKASLVTYVIPVVAVAVGVVVLGEAFQFRLLVGGMMIVAGIAIVHDRVFSRRSAPRLGAAATVILLLVLAACGGNGEGSAGCQPAVRERLHPEYLRHVLPGAEEPDYLSDPPTSGPHQPSPGLAGVVDEAIPPAQQVGLLEAGTVLVQHRDLRPDDQDALAELAGDQVVVAPNPDLPELVVATAWLFKQTCGSVDLDALREFVAERAGHGPGPD